MTGILTARRGTLSGLGFSPASIAGMISWFQADAITGLADGSPVSPWVDSSPAAQNAVAGDRPTYKTAIINGKPIVRFNGNYNLVSPASTSGATQTIFVVVSAGTPSAAGYTIRGANSDGGLQYRLLPAGQSLVKQYVENIGASTSAAPTTPAVLAATFQAGSGYAFYRNGAADGSGTYTGSLTASRTTVLAKNGSSNGEGLIGDLGELIVYNTVLSGTDRSKVTAYLGAKWGITVT